MNAVHGALGGVHAAEESTPQGHGGESNLG